MSLGGVSYEFRVSGCVSDLHLTLNETGAVCRLYMYMGGAIDGELYLIFQFYQPMTFLLARLSSESISSFL